jgi:hypothetical protein
MKKYCPNIANRLDSLLSILTITTFFVLSPLYIYFSGISSLTNFLDGKYYLFEILFFTFLLLRYKPRFNCSLEIIWLVTFLYFILIFIFDLIFTSGVYIKYFHNIVLTSALYYLIGKTIFKANILPLIILAFILLMLNFDINDQRIYFKSAIENDRYSSYLEISHKFIIGILLTNFSLRKDNYMNIIIPLLMISFAFVIGARADLIISILILLIAVFFDTNLRKSAANIIVFLFIFVIMIFYIFHANSRFLNVFQLENDESFIGRMKLLIGGLENILDNPILGDYSIAGGSHIHNYLFYWQKYGITPFLCINFILFYIIFNKISLGNKNNTYVYSYSIISIYIIISVLLFKDGYFEYISLLCGLAGNKFLKRNE